MFSRLFNSLFGCWHSNYTFPITVRHGARRTNQAASLTGTYIVCLDCGKEFPYDWKQMKVVTAPRRSHRRIPFFATKEAS